MYEKVEVYTSKCNKHSFDISYTSKMAFIPSNKLDKGISLLC
jgi:hypothetical protein